MEWKKGERGWRWTIKGGRVGGGQEEGRKGGELGIGDGEVGRRDDEERKYRRGEEMEEGLEDGGGTSRRWGRVGEKEG